MVWVCLSGLRSAGEAHLREVAVGSESVAKSQLAHYGETGTIGEVDLQLNHVLGQLPSGYTG